MVQRPFSEIIAPQQKWTTNNTNLHSLHQNEVFNFPGVTQVKSVFHNQQRQKLSTILTALETSKSKSLHQSVKISKPHTLNELQVLNTSKEYNMPRTMQSTTELRNNMSNQNVKLAIKNYYQIPTPSRFAIVYGRYNQY